MRKESFEGDWGRPTMETSARIPGQVAVNSKGQGAACVGRRGQQ